MTDDGHNSYLAKVSRDLRGDVPARDELHLKQVATIDVGRKTLTVHVVSSTQHGTSVKVTILGPQPPNGGRRCWQDAYVYGDELDALVTALATAKEHLGTAGRPHLPSRKKAPR